MSSKEKQYYVYGTTYSILKNKVDINDHANALDFSRWDFLEHSGPIFPPPYESLPANVGKLNS